MGFINEIVVGFGPSRRLKNLPASPTCVYGAAQSQLRQQDCDRIIPTVNPAQAHFGFDEEERICCARGAFLQLSRNGPDTWWHRWFAMAEKKRTRQNTNVPMIFEMRLSLESGTILRLRERPEY